MDKSCYQNMYSNYSYNSFFTKTKSTSTDENPWQLFFM